MIVSNERPPYVEFYEGSEERRAQDGSIRSTDGIFARVTPIGGRDTVVKEAEDWVRGQEKLAQQDRIPREWARQFRGALEAFKQGLVLPRDGTPIKNWPALRPYEVKRLTELHILTVEDLAGLNEEGRRRLGMGAVDLCQRAQTFLDLQGNSKVANQIAELQQINDALQDQISKLLQEVLILRRQMASTQEESVAVSKEVELPPEFDEDSAIEETIETVLT